MEQTLVVLLVIAVVAVVIWLSVLAARAAAERERRRLAGLASWARDNGFEFSPQDRNGLDARYAGVFEIGRGHDRYAFEVISRADPAPALIFQYHFKTWETRTVTHTDSRGRVHTRVERYEETHWRRYLIVDTGASFPSLAIRPEGWFDRLAGFVGFDDIDFESEQFSRKYHCTADDRQFAYAVIHPTMMEWLLARSVALRLERGMLLMSLTGPHDAATCHAAWGQAAGFIRRIPPFIWEDYGQRRQITFDEPRAPAPPSDNTT